MRPNVLRTRRRHLLWTGTTGALLGLPLTLPASGIVPTADPSDGAAPSIRPAAATTEATPASNPSEPRFQADRYEAEVQRQLRMLYQQGGQPGAQAAAPNAFPNGPAGAPPKPRRMKFKDYFNPTAWKRQMKRRQRYNEYLERQREQAAQSESPDTQLGAPHDMTPGQPAPLAPAVPLPATNPPAGYRNPAASAAPMTPMPAPAPSASAAPTTAFAAPAPAPAATPARPQLERVSPELFGITASDDSTFSSDNEDTFELLLPDAPAELEQPGFMPTADNADLTPIETAEPETPLLLIVPEPKPAQPASTAALPAAPAADSTVEEPLEEPADFGEFGDQSANPFESPVAEAAEPLDDAPGLLQSASEESDEYTSVSEHSGPFTGLELESNPFIDPPAEPVQTPVVDEAPLALPAPVADRPAPTPVRRPAPEAAPRPMLTAPSRTADAKPKDESANPPVEKKTAEATPPVANESSAPPTLTSSEAVRPMPAAPPVVKRTVRPDVQTKLDRIAERQGLTGFKGFCPVMLTDHRELVDAKLEHTSEYEGRRYWFSSEEARERFMLDPTAYVPARGGIDVVIFGESGESREGSLDHAVWFKGQLYLFDSAESRAAFAAAPLDHAVTR